MLRTTTFKIKVKLKWGTPQIALCRSERWKLSVMKQEFTNRLSNSHNRDSFKNNHKHRITYSSNNSIAMFSHSLVNLKLKGYHYQTISHLKVWHIFRKTLMNFKNNFQIKLSKSLWILKWHLGTTNLQQV
jgi:hypothetical protein